MVDAEQLNILRQGVIVWNKWRAKHDEEVIELGGANFNGADLRRVDLHEASLHEANFNGANLSRANFNGANLHGARLCGANLREVNFNGADLRMTDLQRANLWGARLRGANLHRTGLFLVDLNDADLSEANLSKSVMEGVVFYRSNLGRSNLKEAFLRDVHFGQASLIEANLDGAMLQKVSLWETQRTGWSIQGIRCDVAYWDKNEREGKSYIKGEFERLYADKTKIMLHYAGGISTIEFATLPALIQRLEASHPSCALQLESVQEAHGSATVTLIVEEDGSGRTPDELRTLKANIEMVSQFAICSQRILLKGRNLHERIEFNLQAVYDEFFPRILALAQQSCHQEQ